MTPVFKPFDDRDAYTPDPRLHGGLIRNIAHGLHLGLGARIDLEEVQQEVTLFILARRHSYDPAKARFSTWLMRARRTIYSRLRRKYCGHIKQTDGSWRGLPIPGSLDWSVLGRSGDRYRADHLHPAAPTPEPRDDEQLERLRAALRRLPARDRQILRLRASGLTLDQVGNSIGVTRERTRQLERLALGRLARALGVEHPPASLAGAAGRRRPSQPHHRREPVQTLQPVDIGVGAL